MSDLHPGYLSSGGRAFARSVAAYLIAFLAVFATSDVAKSQKTKTQMQTEINTNLPDNTAGLITPLTVRNTLTDMVNSWQQFPGVNAQTTNYTVAPSDYGSLITMNNAAATTITFPQATGNFLTFSTSITNIGAGTTTLTPTTSTICNGKPNQALTSGQSIYVVSDGINYQCFGPTLSAGGGSVTSVGLTMPGVFTVSGSPITSSGVLAVTANGTSGGIPFFSSASTMGSSAALTLNMPVLGGGAGSAPIVGTISGNTTKLASVNTTTFANGNCVQVDASGNLTTVANPCTTGAGTGTVTSVALAAPAIFTVSGSPVTTSGTLGLTAAGTSGGIPYFSSATAMASSAALTLNAPVLGGGGAGAPTSGTVSGTTTKFATVGATFASGNCVQVDANGNLTTIATSCSASGSGVTSVGLSMPGGIFSVGGSPVTSSGVISVSIRGTSGGIVYFDTATTIASSNTLALSAPVVGGGAGSGPTTGTRTGNTTLFATANTTTFVASRCVQTDASSNLITTGGVCVLGTPTTLTAVASLPTCNAVSEGTRGYVTDNATAFAWRGAVTSGGTNRGPVICGDVAGVKQWLQD